MGWGGGSATVKFLISGRFPFVAGVGGGYNEGDLSSSICVCEERSRRRRGGRATSWAGCKVSIWPLRLTPHTHAHTITPVTGLWAESGRATALSWPGPEQVSHPSMIWQRRETSSWAIFQVSFEDRFFSQKLWIAWLGISPYLGHRTQEFGCSVQPIWPRGPEGLCATNTKECEIK